MSDLKRILLEEIDEFREKGHKFVNKELTVAEFKGISGGFGVYAHRGGKEFMIRLRIPSGVTNIKELKQVYKWAKEYNIDKIHLTTRQAIQYHGISIDDACDIMKDGIDKDIYTRGSGGNFPRNVALSPLSGVALEEVFDVTPYALSVNNYFLQRIYTYKLPRKLKVAFSSSNLDEAHCTVSDLGFIAVEKDGNKYFNVYSGGGLGRNPSKAVIVDEFIDPKDVLYHIEAMTNMFIAEGDYENKGKARIRYILARMGEEEYKTCYKKHLDMAKAKGDLTLDILPKEYNKIGIETCIKHSRLFNQRQKGLYSVYFHPIGGQLILEDLKAIIDSIDSMEDIEVRLSMTEGMYIRNLNGVEAEKILEITQNKGGETKVEQSVSCIGVPICQIGVLHSQETLNDVVKFLKEKGIKENSLPRIYISGCPNSCGVHEIGEIGFVGKIKRVNDETRKVFELHAGGSFKVGKTKLGDNYGDIPHEEVPNFLYEIAQLVEKSERDFNEWFKENNYLFKEIVFRYSI